MESESSDTDKSSPPGPVREADELELISGVGSESSLEPLAGMSIWERSNESMTYEYLESGRSSSGGGDRRLEHRDSSVKDASSGAITCSVTNPEGFRF